MIVRSRSRVISNWFSKVIDARYWFAKSFKRILASTVLWQSTLLVKLPVSANWPSHVITRLNRSITRYRRRRLTKNKHLLVFFFNFFPIHHNHHCSCAAALEEPVKEVESVALLVSRPSFPVDPPVFTQIFGNGTVDVGGRLVFDCIINGCPVPNVRVLYLCCPPFTF